MNDHVLVGTIWRHKKTRRVYVVMGQCRLEATNAPGLLYRSAQDGTTWARDLDEFLDGRFEPVEIEST